MWEREGGRMKAALGKVLSSWGFHGIALTKLSGNVNLFWLLMGILFIRITRLK